MKKLQFKSGVLLLLLALMSEGQAKQDHRYIPVFCDQGHSLQDALDRATEGATLDVYGTCNEAVVVETDRLSIGAFFGQATTISPPVGSIAFTVLADRVEISDLNITGGDRAIRITKGSSATIRDNHIFDSAGWAILIDSNSYGEIIGNTLNSESNSGSIQILVAANSYADIDGNSITASSGFGVLVAGASSASVAGNDISGAIETGIAIAQSSNMFFPGPNEVDILGPVDIFCAASGSLQVAATQNTTGPVFLEAGCDLIITADGVIFP